MKLLKRISYIALFFLCCRSPLVLADDTFVDLDSSLGLDDNVTRANYKSDVERDVFLSLQANMHSELWRGRKSLLTANGLLATRQFNKFHGLTNYSLGGDATYSFGFSDGFGAPWFALNISGRVTEFDSALRDSNFAGAKFTVHKRIDDRTDSAIGVGMEKRNAYGSAFCLKNKFGFANLDLTVATRQTVYLSYMVHKGQTFSTSSLSHLSLAALDAAGSANEPDDVFTGKRTYRLDAITQMLTVGYNHAFDETRSYDVSIRYLRSRTKVDLKYQDILVLVGYFQRVSLGND